ncbi:MAG: dUTP diphosphatase [Hyphomicrobiales bacterium]|nr:dUTP diphosphatase [Hyphomicrobiales bacterium]MDE2115301.1 dUTP diphosphatase [Hyphomicrobiales bacterium]
MRLKLNILRLPHGEGLDLPAYQTAGAAGLDLLAAVPENAPLAIAPGARILVPTGLIFEIPQGFEGQVRPRSGLALKHGLSVLNAPGTIDSDYRGEVGVLLINHGAEEFIVRRGLRIAQLILAPVAFAELVAVEMVETTIRGNAGYGSTGMSPTKI